MSERRSLVIDASAVIDVLRGSERGERVADAIADATLAAPDVIDGEIVQALRGLERGGQLSQREATRALHDHLAAPIRRESSLRLAERAWELRHNLSAYDAMSVALAEQLSCPVVTSDRKWGRVDLVVPVITIS